MLIAHSTVTSQGQISIPAEVRRRLGAGPGSVLEWDEQDGSIVVRKAADYQSEDIHRAIFPKPPARRSLAELKSGLRRNVKGRHAGR